VPKEKTICHWVCVNLEKKSGGEKKGGPYGKRGGKGRNESWEAIKGVCVDQRRGQQFDRKKSK